MWRPIQDFNTTIYRLIFDHSTENDTTFADLPLLKVTRDREPDFSHGDGLSFGAPDGDLIFSAPWVSANYLPSVAKAMSAI